MVSKMRGGTRGRAQAAEGMRGRWAELSCLVAFSPRWHGCEAMYRKAGIVKSESSCFSAFFHGPFILTISRLSRNDDSEPTAGKRSYPNTRDRKLKRCTPNDKNSFELTQISCKRTQPRSLPPPSTGREAPCPQISPRPAAPTTVPSAAAFAASADR